MTYEQINAAIAEACGWKSHDHPDCMAKKVEWIMPEKWIMRPDGTLAFRHDIPNYCNDLNAMHEAENCLSLDNRNHYIDALGTIYTDSWEFATATARQRAEAFLRTLGKWEEVQK